MKPITVTLDGQNRENAMRLAQLIGKPVEQVVNELIKNNLALRESQIPMKLQSSQSSGMGPSAGELELLDEDFQERTRGYVR